MVKSLLTIICSERRGSFVLNCPFRLFFLYPDVPGCMSVGSFRNGFKFFFSHFFFTFLCLLI